MISLRNIAGLAVFLGLLEALTLAQSGGDLASMGDALAGLARAAQAQGRAQESVLQYEMALAAFEGAQDTRGQAAVLIALGRAHTRAARYDLALAQLQRAVKLCAKLGDADRYAEALEVLGIAEAADGDLEAARRTLTDAGLAYRHAGAPQNAERVATRLQELERGSSLGEQ